MRRVNPYETDLRGGLTPLGVACQSPVAEQQIGQQKSSRWPFGSCSRMSKPGSQRATVLSHSCDFWPMLYCPNARAASLGFPNRGKPPDRHATFFNQNFGLTEGTESVVPLLGPKRTPPPDKSRRRGPSSRCRRLGRVRGRGASNLSIFQPSTPLKGRLRRVRAMGQVMWCA